MDWDRTEVSRRVQAVMVLAGYRSVEKFAEEVTIARGVGLKRLRQLIQRKGDDPRAVELREIAEGGGLPYEFFTADFATLGDSDPTLREEFEGLRDQVNLIQRQLVARAESRTSGLESEQPPGTPGTGDPR